MQKLLIVTTKTPFIKDAAFRQARQLARAAERAGFETDILALNLNACSPGDIVRSMYTCEAENLTDLDAGPLDHVICLSFPATYVRHPRKRVWLRGLHRPAYDGWVAGAAHEAYDTWMRDKVIEKDKEHLSPLAPGIFVQSAVVAAGLESVLDLPSTVLHPPPALDIRPRGGEAERFILAPGRGASLEAQALLVAAMRHVRSDIKVLLPGPARAQPQLREMIDRAGVGSTCIPLGRLSDAQLAHLYATAMAVFCGSPDGEEAAVTLEAMLSGRPVIACRGGGLAPALVVHGINGLVAEPTPEAVAAAVDQLADNPALALRFGRNGFDSYLAAGIGWDQVLHQLLGAPPPRGGAAAHDRRR